MALAERSVRPKGPTLFPTDPALPLTERILRLGRLVAVAGVVAQVLSQFVNYVFFDFEIWALNVDADDNSFAWASSVAQFAVALCCLLLLLGGWWSFRPLLGLTLILVYFSLDDITSFHEEITFAFREDVLGIQVGWGRVLWPIMFLPLLAAAFLLLRAFAGRAPAAAGRAIRLGLVLLVLAVAAEAFSTVLHLGEDEHGNLADVVQVAVEESLELSAWILIASAAAATLCANLQAMGRGQQQPTP